MEFPDFEEEEMLERWEKKTGIEPKGTWRILVPQDTAGPSRHNHGKMQPWKSLASSFQDVPQVSVKKKFLCKQKISAQRKYFPTTVD